MILGTAAHPFRPFEDWIRVVHLVEELGYGMTCQSENPTYRADPFVDLGVAARETTRLLLATTVAVPAPPNPAVMAAAAAGVDEVSHGRAVLTIGRGVATTRAIGERPLTNQLLGSYTATLRALLRGETATWNGTEIQLRWVRRAVPVLLAAFGPKALQLAGAYADGVMISSAVAGAPLADAIATVRAAAREAGRVPEELTIWVVARASVGDDRDEALADLKAILAAAGRQLDENEPGLHDDQRAALVELKSRYVEEEHVVSGGANDRLIEELGLLDYLAERFAITGTAEQCRGQLQALADLGVDCVFLNGAMRNEERMIISMAEQVGVEFHPGTERAFDH